MITRKEYMTDSTANHQAYYLQIAQMANLKASHLPVTLDAIREALKTDRHLNNIPLVEWDIKAHAVRVQVMRVERECGDTAPAPLDGVCALKALARHLVEDNQS